MIHNLVTALARVGINIMARTMSDGMDKLTDRIDKHTYLCAKCKTHVAKDARCCPHCGATEITNQSALNKLEAAEQQARNEAAARTKQREKELKKARARLVQLATKKMCMRCSAIYPSEFNFCTQCTDPTVPFPPERLFAVLHAEFPNAVREESDLASVRQTQ